MERWLPVETERLYFENFASAYILNRRYWNHGFATEASLALLNLAFCRVNLRRVWATCDSRNRASFRFMEKLGMRRDAMFPKDVFQKGEWRDSYLYALLAEVEQGIALSGDSALISAGLRRLNRGGPAKPQTIVRHHTDLLA